MRPILAGRLLSSIRTLAEEIPLSLQGAMSPFLTSKVRSFPQLSAGNGWRLQSGRPELSGQWTDPPEQLPLPGAGVHVWRVSLTNAAEVAQRLRPLLAADERERADRFRFDRHRDAYTASRGTLRQVLSLYLSVTPEEIRFVYGAQGKPSLANEVKGNGIEFNLSHSGEVALVAITQGRRIGVDVERIRSEVASDAIARRYFSAREVETLLALEERVRLNAFFACWCRKEAYLKARGDGLTHPLDTFDVSLAPHEYPTLLATYDDPGEADRWRLHALEAGPGYAAALAVECGEEALQTDMIQRWRYPLKG